MLSTLVLTHELVIWSGCLSDTYLANWIWEMYWEGLDIAAKQTGVNEGWRTLNAHLPLFVFGKVCDQIVKRDHIQQTVPRLFTLLTRDIDRIRLWRGLLGMQSSLLNDMSVFLFTRTSPFQLSVIVLFWSLPNFLFMDDPAKVGLVIANWILGWSPFRKSGHVR